MQCATTGEPATCKYPFFLLEAMRGNEDTRRDAGISASTLGACPRFVTLAGDHDYYESPQDYKARFTGSVIHGGIEAYTSVPGVIAERRYYRQITLTDGRVVVISGKMDIVLPQWKHVGKIVDMKTGGRRQLTPTMEPYDSHTEQVNEYRWILDDPVDADPIRVGEAAIIYIKDGAMQEVPVELWPLAVTEAHIRARLEELLLPELPPILPDQSNGKRHWKCDRCPLRDVCDSFPPEGIGWFEEEEEW
jgi:CRISPR/Cas system-associated exonuclease Cas4 (RecB family)